MDEARELTQRFNEITRVRYKKLDDIKNKYMVEGIDISDPNFAVTDIDTNSAIELVTIANLSIYFEVLNMLAMYSPSQKFFNQKFENLSTILAKVYQMNELEESVWNSIALTTSGLTENLIDLKESLLQEFVYGVDMSEANRAVYTFYMLSSSIAETINACQILSMNISMQGFDSEWGGMVTMFQMWITSTKMELQTYSGGSDVKK